MDGCTHRGIGDRPSATLIRRVERHDNGIHVGTIYGYECYGCGYRFPPHYEPSPIGQIINGLATFLLWAMIGTCL